VPRTFTRKRTEMIDGQRATRIDFTERDVRRFDTRATYRLD
jgi:hypothetical protein